MSIPLDMPEESTGTSNKIGPGAFVGEVEIKEVIDRSNYPHTTPENVFRFKSGYQPELCLEVTFIDGERERMMYIFGYFEYTDKKKTNFKGWKEWNNFVQRFLVVVNPGKVSLEDDWSIPESLIKACVGQKFMRVTYISNKPYTDKEGNQKNYSYSNWQKVFAPGTAIEEITENWNVERGKQYSSIKDYDEMLAKSVEASKSSKDDTSFEYGANVPTAEEEIF